ncbi:MAG TPA: sigma-70 family RNA polymerase sigma factor [Acidobacteriaceae bacterium]|jgi:RNA polymerase sigma-70 factor (ECF subfamily)|nr:sigma-70 family RNA polymerase sigma factor [Acidobacteriaceae bacterium]
MDERDWLAQQFEENRRHLRGVAYRMLGSLSEAEDAVQECWLRTTQSEMDNVANLRGWLTTVVARICLDMLRSRKSRREEPLEVPGGEPAHVATHTPDPESEALLADSVGFAMLVVLDRLSPAERIAFVLHDLFDLPFEDIARIAGRSPEATRQLASRARRRVRGASQLNPSELGEQRSLVDRFLAALRRGDVAGIVGVLAPDFAVHADAVAAAALARVPAEIHGAEAWAREAVKAARGAHLARPALVEGGVGVVVAPRGRLFRVLRLTFREGRIAHMEVIGDPQRLGVLDLGVLTD